MYMKKSSIVILVLVFSFLLGCQKAEEALLPTRTPTDQSEVAITRTMTSTDEVTATVMPTMTLTPKASATRTEIQLDGYEFPNFN